MWGSQFRHSWVLNSFVTQPIIIFCFVTRAFERIKAILSALEIKDKEVVKRAMTKFNPKYEKRDLEEVNVEIENFKEDLRQITEVYDELLDIKLDITDVGTRHEIKTYWKVRKAAWRKIAHLKRAIAEAERAKKMVSFFDKMEAVLTNLAGYAETKDDEILSEDEDEDSFDGEDSEEDQFVDQPLSTVCYRLMDPKVPPVD